MLFLIFQPCLFIGRSPLWVMKSSTTRSKCRGVILCIMLPVLLCCLSQAPSWLMELTRSMQGLVVGFLNPSMVILHRTTPFMIVYHTTGREWPCGGCLAFGNWPHCLGTSRAPSYHVMWTTIYGGAHGWSLGGKMWLSSAMSFKKCLCLPSSAP